MSLTEDLVRCDHIGGCFHTCGDHSFTDGDVEQSTVSVDSHWCAGCKRYFYVSPELPQNMDGVCVRKLISSSPVGLSCPWCDALCMCVR